MRRRYILVGLILVVSVVLLIQFLTLRPEQKKIYFVTLGSFSSPLLGELLEYYKQKYGLTVELLPEAKIEPWLIDYKRRQLIAEEVIKQMKRDYPQLADDRAAVLIGITSRDMYIRDYKWQFALSWREGGRFAVVSSARMDPVFFGGRPSEEILQVRLRKMITKNIGLMYYGYSQSSDPKSVLYSSILSIDDLDRIGEDF